MRRFAPKLSNICYGIYTISCLICIHTFSRLKMSRETLAPPLLRMGPGRCYRVNVVHDHLGGRAIQEEEQQAYIERDLFGEDDDEDDLVDCAVEETENGIYKLTMHVAQPFYGGLIGFKGATKRRIENETRTEIYIPKNHMGTGKKDENIVIKGPNRTNVFSARRQIKLLIFSLRKRMRATHFIGVALNYGEIRKNFLEFKKSILDLNLPGIEDKLFTPEGRLHITLSVCVLLDDAERQQAIDILQGSREYLSDLCTPFDIKVAGLEIMNDDPSAVRVVYASIEAPELQKYADRCLEAFLHSGLGLDEFGRKHVKMHMTVLNAKFLLKDNPNAPDKFDAREILKKYGNYSFGTTKCNEIELCIRGTYIEEGEAKGFYKRSSAFKIVKL